MPPNRKWFCLSLAWLLVVGTSITGLSRYAVSAGEAAPAPAVYPAAGNAEPVGSRHRLIVALHPHCPCSRATVRMLERLVTRCGDRLDVRVLLVRPDGAGPDWEATDLARSAAAIPEVRTVVDDGGAEAARLGARTSGHAVLYDAAGRLAFSGGITPARGHEGDNAGVDLIEGTVLGGGPAVSTTHNPPVTPVFGCALATPERNAELSR